MSIQEARVEIDKILDSLPQESVLSVLNYLKSTQSLRTDDQKLANDFNRIIKEDEGLLKRLAQ
ncbi:MAG: hypothetical protein AAF388_06775 [Bacteroidota bacterium]